MKMKFNQDTVTNGIRYFLMLHLGIQKGNFITDIYYDFDEIMSRTFKTPYEDTKALKLDFKVHDNLFTEFITNDNFIFDILDRFISIIIPDRTFVIHDYQKDQEDWVVDFEIMNTIGQY